MRSGYRTVVGVAAPRRRRARRLQPRPHARAVVERPSRRPPASCASRRPACATASSPPACGSPSSPSTACSAAAAPSRAGATGRRRGALRSFADLRTGDIVVHEDHGVARFAGFDTKTVAGVIRDYLQLEFAGTDKRLHARRPAGEDQPLRRRGRCAPARSASSAASRGRRSRPAPGARPRSWPASCSTSTPSARRRQGHAFPEDSEWLREFEAALPVAGDGRPARGDRARQDATWSARSRWTA